ncbi:MAG: sugar ABC transporter ATP-binding protein [Candidatus Pelethousia sp.]|nr:sugar ABC transporter ATP-binding protein [Candidatus Pelethousia sp.]
MQPILEVVSIEKSYPGVNVLKGISFSLERGKIYSLVGENGAGKSTLIKIIMGLERADAGSICINGTPAKIANVQQARNAYMIDAVFQEHSLIPDMTVGENMLLDRLQRLRKGPLLSHTEINAHAEKALSAVNLELDVSRCVSTLTEGEKSIVELAKVIARNPDVIILDEITAALEYEKVDELFALLNGQKEKGKTFIFISHRMEEVLRYADEILVLKEGVLANHLVNEQKIDTKEMRQVIIESMTGITGGIDFPERPEIAEDAPRILQIRGLCTDALHNIDLDVKKGEILCLAGLSGQGQSELLRTIAGDLPVKGGVIEIEGREAKLHTIRDAMKAGLFYISDRRDAEETWPQHDLMFNMVLASTHKRAKCGVISKRTECSVAQRMVEKLKIEAPGLEKLIRYLSGGNRQKVVIARYLLAGPKLLILNQPTIGLDITTKIEIYRLLRELADAGMACLALFTEREEILFLPDRLVVMYEGAVVKQFGGRAIDERELVRSYYK